MNKLLIFIFRLALLVALAAWLTDRPGTAQITWHGYIIETSASILSLVVLAVGFIIFLIFRLGHLIKYGPSLWRVNRNLKKFRDGQKYLTQGMVALASGHATEAGRLAVSARKELGVTTATQLLQAQAAQLAGDHTTARELFQALADNSESAALGYRGLIMDARRRGDWNEVEALAEKLYQLKPEIPWLNLIRFDILVRRQDWLNAHLALSHLTTSRSRDTENTKNLKAAVLVARSQQEATHGHLATALQLAEQATQQRQNWLPAVINLVQQQIASGHKRTAYRTIGKYWPRLPHPQLARLYHQEDHDPIDIYKKLQHLCIGDDPVDKLILAESALAANIWGEARRHLIELVNRRHATRTAYKLLARLERRESGNEAAAQQWLSQAFDATPDPVWLCSLCGGSHQQWQVTCSHCGHFNTLEWGKLGQSRKIDHVAFVEPHNWIE